jgi:hypothetical protein
MSAEKYVLKLNPKKSQVTLIHRLTGDFPQPHLVIDLDKGKMVPKAVLHLQFLDFFGWPTIKTNGNTQKLSSTHCSGGEELWKNQKFSWFWDLVSVFMEFLQLPDFFGWPKIKTNGKTRKLSSKHVFQNLLKFWFFSRKIPALLARSPSETCLELSFWKFSLLAT